MIQVNPDAGAELMLSSWLLEELLLPSGRSTRMLVGECIRLLAKSEQCEMNVAAEFILKQAQMAKLSGDQVGRFWFEDQRYMVPSTPSHATVGMYRPTESNEAQRDAEDRAAYAMWLQMSAAYKLERPWTGKVYA